MKSLALAVMASLLAVAALSAKTLDVPDQGLHFEVPDSWASKPAQGGAVFAAGNAANTSEFVLTVQGNPISWGLDQPEFAAGTKNNIINNLAAKNLTPNFTKEGQIDINGVPFYQLEGATTVTSGHTMYFQVYFTATADHVYTVSFQSVDPNATAELEGIANSLAFAQAPTMPDPNRPKTHMQRVIHKLMLPAAIGLVVLIIVGIVLFFVLRNKSGRGRGRRRYDDEEE